MGLLRDWWDRMLGREDEPPHAVTPPARHPARTEQPTAQSGKDLELQPDKGGRPDTHRGTAGFDPYGNDAGFAKPHGWERIDHD